MTSHFPPHPPIQAVAPPRGVPRLLAWLASALAVLLVLGAAGQGAVMWHGQRADLSDAQSSRDAAVQALDAALTQAEADGLTPAQLADLSHRRDALLAQASLAARWIWFDGGETGHLRDQAAALAALRRAVAPLVVQATDTARSADQGLEVGVAQHPRGDVGADAEDCRRRGRAGAVPGHRDPRRGTARRRAVHRLAEAEFGLLGYAARR